MAGTSKKTAEKARSAAQPGTLKFTGEECIFAKSDSYPRIILNILLLLLVISLVSGCAGGLGPGQWSQFHADGPNQGFLAVHSTPAFKPKWTVDLGDYVAFSSPVLSKDGSIYVGASKGLIKISHDGVIQWKTSFPDPDARILSSPAVGPDGNIYVISTKTISDNRYDSQLHSITSNGSINWSRNFGGISDIYTTSSPKIWGNEKNGNIFVYLKKLYVFSQDGRLLAGCDLKNHCTTIIGTSWFSAFFEALGGFFAALFSGDLFTFDVSALNWHEAFGWPDPTIAIVSYPKTKFEFAPLIVVANVCGMTGIQWEPADNKLNTLWVWNLPDPKKPTSPAVFPSGTIAIGREDGLVEFVDTETGTKLAQYEAGEKLVSTPVSLLGVNFYVTSLRHLHEVTANGQLLSKFDLKGETLASPAVTADAIYMSTLAGLETLTLDYAGYGVDLHASGGVSSPAVGDDGTIYMITTGGQLRAYPGVK